MAISAALALADSSEVLLLAPTPTSKGRQFALGWKALKFLEQLGVEFKSNPVRRFLLFADKHNSTLESKKNSTLCRVVCETELMRALCKRLKQSSVLQDDFSPVARYTPTSNGVELILDDRRCFLTGLLAAADGAKSRIAQCAGIGAAIHSFEQLAISATLTAPMDDDTAAQWFGQNDTLALLPIGGGHFSLIWSLCKNRALTMTNTDDLATAVANRTGWKIRAINDKIENFELTALRRAVRCAPGLAFLGEAARVIHPLAGQGLNMGLADSEWLAKCAQKNPTHPTKTLADYAAGREIKTEFFHLLTAAFSAGYPASVALRVGKKTPFYKLAASGANL